MKTVLSGAALTLLLVGCESSKPVAAPIERRFEGVSGVGEQGVALDTVTGQWCKTWDWSYKNDAMSGGLDTLPTCVSIYNDARVAALTK